MALNNLSRALSDEERASRYRRASTDTLRGLGISDVVDEATGLTPDFHPSTFGRRVVGPVP
ncbi:MAG: hypothetical protein DRJ56_01050 [Thermoprotei archaeon]|nr:MAG: hypothetical protein DRJ56_01050 [Thermoprotei archaeon]